MKKPRKAISSSSAPKLTESVFQRQVLNLSRSFGWEDYHTTFSLGSKPGFPDLILWHPERKLFLFVEIKTETGKLQDNQHERLLSLYAAAKNNKAENVKVYLWRPKDIEQITRILAPPGTVVSLF